eukprot:CAMPEP_0198318854 /NCGR_PEP_ID=MMETSP1450-20131203/8121_1 /TAXON_ID=753684 ORGANISM="Madagascaria erythrocladiodes, Strain CCMP3234" /NCGR_SAMPLE_ID=MMETSP1450 /ASSEMBLY_ACC=CAM_ASM_001115 /LENGTH=323 /DNA_ID=CAMNT_0044022197 /DNA_START=30 /DNA_END=1001 /DNA_ORIENTATION=-
MTHACPICPDTLATVALLEVHVNEHIDAEEQAERARAGGGLRGSLADGAEEVSPAVMTLVRKSYLMTSPQHLRRVHLASELDHFSSNAWGHGWDCSFRVIQIMLSSLLRYDVTRDALLRAGVVDVPALIELQRLIERAWSMGFDVESARELESLQGETTWIGAHEVVALLRSLGIRAFVTDFDTATMQGKKDLFNWVFEYFATRCGAARLRQGTCTYCTSTRRSKFIPPLYLLYPGHSMTVVGCEQYADKSRALLVLDGQKQPVETLRRTTQITFRHAVTSHVFAKPRFQVVGIGSTPSPVYASQSEIEAAKVVVSQAPRVSQ